MFRWKTDKTGRRAGACRDFPICSGIALVQEVMCHCENRRVQEEMNETKITA